MYVASVRKTRQGGGVDGSPGGSAWLDLAYRTSVTAAKGPETDSDGLRGRMGEGQGEKEEKEM